MEASSHLPSGNSLTLQARSRNGKRARPDPAAIGRVHVRREERTSRSGRNDSEGEISEAATTTTPQRSKPATKLPILKPFADKDPNQPNSTSTPPHQKERSPSVRSHSRISYGILERESPRSTDKEREQYWQKVRDKSDNNSPPSRSKDKQKDYYHEAYRKIVSLASSSRQEISKHTWKHSGIAPVEKEAYTPSAGLRAQTINKSSDSGPLRRRSSQSEREGDPGRHRRGPLSSDRSTSLGKSVATLQGFSDKTDNITNSSDKSGSSVSPVSGPATSITEWEDRFIVNMPSAREPNPPIMNVHQIAEFQKSIEKVHKDGGAMLDPDTLPSPRTTTPEEQTKPVNLLGSNKKAPREFDGQDSHPVSSAEDDEGALAYPHHSRRYYCPDEIGKQRISTIWEESSTRPKRKPLQPNRDGSFLGCKEINGPNNRNPDEILFFSTDERPKVVSIPPHIPKIQRESKLATTHQMLAALEEKTVAQEEWKPISQNLKNAQCSKPSPRTVCHEVQCQLLDGTEKTAKGSGKENTEAVTKPVKSVEKGQAKPKPDDVFIITPTITRTMVTMTDIRGHIRQSPGIQEPTSRSAGEIITDARTRLRINNKPRVSASPSGLRRASQNSWEKSSGPSVLPSKATPTTNTLAGKSRGDTEIAPIEKPRTMRGYIRTPGIPRSSTESLVTPMSCNIQSPSSARPATKASSICPAKNIAESPHLGPSCPTTGIPPSTHLVSTNRQESHGTIREAKVVVVAELDGQQVNDHREDHVNAKPRLATPDLQTSEIQPNNKGNLNLETLNLILYMLVQFAMQVQCLYRQFKENRGSKAVLLKLFLNGIIKMLEHCLHVLRNILAAISIYNATGTWPRTNDKDLARSLSEFGQAMFYVVVLGFITVVIGRAVGYVVLIGSWIMWFTRPFVIVLNAMGRALLI